MQEADYLNLVPNVFEGCKQALYTAVFLIYKLLLLRLGFAGQYFPQ